eukprot:Tamp_28233.p1 GENE.Tamp_28233~~Tamp_28233.p1  ORF type:complete len:141 (+),score=32.31 Tamp_28233:295-717(+)
MAEQAAQGEQAAQAASSCAHIREHHFQDVLHEVRVCGQIIAMKDCYMIWIGSGNPSFANLDVAMCSNLDSMPVTSSLMSSGTEGVGSSLSQRLAMKLKAQVFVSYNLPTSMPNLQEAVEKTLFEKVKALQLADQMQALHT